MTVPPMASQWWQIQGQDENEDWGTLYHAVSEPQALALLKWCFDHGDEEELERFQDFRRVAPTVKATTRGRAAWDQPTPNRRRR